ncbi:MAG: PrsW family glutamic-type intramembrane protease [Patescibacteria group bacterium]
MLLDPKTLLYALLGGILPAVLWLWFWLKEDSKKPEPRSMIMLSFIAGMIGVIVVFPLEKIAAHFLVEGPMLLLVWAAIEELVKFSAISLVALRSVYFDEPVDALIYMITVALGFAAIENSLFLLAPLLDGDLTGSLLTGNLRYMGATLLHTAASSAIGIALGLSFYKSGLTRVLSGILGVITAIALHTLFNFFIIQRNGEDTFIVFLHLWVAIVFVIFFFEKVKRIIRTN